VGLLKGRLTCKRVDVQTVLQSLVRLYFVISIEAKPPTGSDPVVFEILGFALASLEAGEPTCTNVKDKVTKATMPINIMIFAFIELELIS
jgi:hypothetical protein